MKPSLCLSLALLGTALPGSACSKAFDVHDPQSPLRLVRSIELPGVRGRIDHMAFDPVTNHLFVAEYGNGSVDVVDLASGNVAERISGLREPQGVAWMPRQAELAVASGDGSLRFFRVADRQLVAMIQIGDDADNVRVDARNGNLVVGYGSGGLAVVDPTAHRVIRQLKLGAHPEAFALIGSRVFANVPDVHEIALADLDEARVITAINTGVFSGNFPMAADGTGSRMAVAYRFPSRLAVLDTNSTTTTWSAPICGDADDLYFHANQIIVVCGEGAVELVNNGMDHGSSKVTTARGARTGLLLPEKNVLFVAVPSRGGPAAIWEFAFR